MQRGASDAARSPAVKQHGTAAYNAFNQGKVGTGIRCAKLFLFDIAQSLSFLIHFPLVRAPKPSALLQTCTSEGSNKRKRSGSDLLVKGFLFFA
jgi:hypothetical protein